MNKHIYFFPNGNTAVFVDEEQNPNLQQAWIRLFFDHLVKHGEDPETFIIRLPDGKYARPWKLKDGTYTWTIRDTET